MTPVQTSLEVIARIEELDRQKQKEMSYIQPIRRLRRAKIKDINERLELNWKWLYQFYPNLCSIKHAVTFRDLITSGYLENRVRLEVVGEESFVAGSKEWSDYLRERKNIPDPYADMIGGSV